MSWQPVPTPDAVHGSSSDFAAPQLDSEELPVLHALDQPGPQYAAAATASAIQVHPEILRELSSLQARRSADNSSDSYLDQLRQLGHESPPWLGIRTPERSSVLHSSGSSPQWLQELTQLQVNRATPAAIQPPEQPSDAVTSSSPISVLFNPVGTISLSDAVVTVNRPSLQQMIDESRVAGDAQGYILPARPGSGPAPLSMRISIRDSYALHHNPLYFEDPDLERCGVSHGCLTPAVSAVRFAADTVLLPWKMAADPPCSEVRTLGDCRTGAEFPAEARGLPISLRGMAAEAGVITALIFIIP